MTVLSLSKKDVSCSKLRPSTFAMVPAIVLLAAMLSRTRVSLACLVLLSSLLWFDLVALLTSASLSAPEAGSTPQPLTGRP